MTKILHLCSDYAGTPLYKELVEALDRKGTGQVIYVPVRSADLINNYKSNEVSSAKFVYSYILNPSLRLNYFRKINKIYSDVKTRMDCSDFDLVHAHFLFSDGGVALKLKKYFDLEYIVTVRNTDINLFFKYLLHTREFGLRILIEAKKIIFLSTNYKDILLYRHVPVKLRQKIEAKSEVIPNGINAFWLDNLNKPKIMKKGMYSLIYAGEFSRNKNIESVIKVLDHLIKKGKKTELILIGQYGDNVARIERLVRKRMSCIKSIPRITARNKLLHFYRDADIFIMPSFYETFGLAYLEAMSQGLPVIYSKGQGFAGYYKDGEVGYAVDPGKIDEIVEKLEMIANNYEEISERCIEEAKNFSWDRIAMKYINLYGKADPL